ncbi:autotransporter outer membrane beta-barrel domain-containing protein [Actinobacillus equuli subsp. equuli]|uniref:Autotransporter outer membrane beta-barrel domain-containing protein n=1 Tax=Actinobacillus equuli subsp. equuli TaxID=202947 RepID=A0A9X4G3Q2_ACTEU|nr:autotransporter outer membrane beta-barrel domain-containing protein [Actinobacillus equuli]MDE8035212.1 autotransporter outer membrane beta-barrel domain-containing protein [Actinobacillus equuli subsp. equuli]
MKKSTFESTAGSLDTKNIAANNISLKGTTLKGSNDTTLVAFRNDGEPDTGKIILNQDLTAQKAKGENTAQKIDTPTLEVGTTKDTTLTLGAGANVKVSDELNIGSHGVLKPTEDLSLGEPNTKLNLKGNINLLKTPNFTWNGDLNSEGGSITINSDWPSQNHLHIKGDAHGDLNVDVTNKKHTNVKPKITYPFLSIDGNDSLKVKAKTSQQGLYDIDVDSVLNNGKKTYFLFAVKAPLVSVVSQQPMLNQEMMESYIGTWKQRIADRTNDRDAWVRTNVSNNDHQTYAGGFGSKSKQGFVQAGTDFEPLSSDNVKTGMMFTYGWANNNFYDEEIGTSAAASSKNKNFTLGFYNTHHLANGVYLDFVAQTSHMEIKIKDNKNRKYSPSAYGLALSAEVGKSIATDTWKIEPQAQLIFSHLHLGSIAEGNRHFQAKDLHSVKARIGSRFGWIPEENAPSLYAQVNLHQRLLGNKTRTMVNDMI